MIEQLLLKYKFELLLIDLACLYTYLFGIIWSIFFPKKRIWPPPKKWSWQYLLTWILFLIIFPLNILFIFIDWDTWIISTPFRFHLAIPLIILGTILFFWGIITLGLKNTSGIRDQFITTGPYRFTRNPQYLGDIILFIGIIIFSNSIYVLVTNFLLSLIFVITPWAEEVWLEEQYGNNYIEYKKKVPRFL